MSIGSKAIISRLPSAGITIDGRSRSAADTLFARERAAAWPARNKYDNDSHLQIQTERPADLMFSSPLRAVWYVVGMLALAAGAVGVVLPLLPTTPFLLLAAFAFARSSDRWNQWLLSHAVFGPIIVDWQRERAIGRSTKVVGVVGMAAVFGLSVALGASAIILAVQAVVLSVAAVILLSRPLPDRSSERG